MATTIEDMKRLLDVKKAGKVSPQGLVVAENTAYGKLVASNLLVKEATGTGRGKSYVWDAAHAEANADATTIAALKEFAPSLFESAPSAGDGEPGADTGAGTDGEPGAGNDGEPGNDGE